MRSEIVEIGMNGERAPAPRFEIRCTNGLIRGQKYHVALIAANGEVLSTSEKLSSLNAAMTNIESQQVNAPNSPVVIRRC